MFHSLIGGFKSNDAAKVRIFFFFQSPAFFSMVREWPLFKDFSLYKDFCVKLYKEHFVSGVSGCKSSLPHPPQRGPGMAGGATGATVPPTAALAAAFCFSIVQSNV